jgi:hypothetical protein
MVMRNKRSKEFEPAWWQRAIAGERLPNPVFRRPKCEGTVEDHRNIALDVRELIRNRVFEQPVGSAFRLQLRFPWLRQMRLNSSTLDLELVTDLHGRVACRHCNDLWYAAQRTSSTARKFLTKRKSGGSSAIMARSQAPGSRRSRAGCGGEPMRGIARRWPG